MSSCRHDYGYKKSWITSRMLCTFSKVSKPEIVIIQINNVDFRTKMPAKVTVEDH